MILIKNYGIKQPRFSIGDYLVIMDARCMIKFSIMLQYFKILYYLFIIFLKILYCYNIL